MAVSVFVFDLCGFAVYILCFAHKTYRVVAYMQHFPSSKHFSVFAWYITETPCELNLWWRLSVYQFTCIPYISTIAVWKSGAGNHISAFDLQPILSADLGCTTFFFLLPDPKSSSSPDLHCWGGSASFLLPH